MRLRPTGWVVVVGLLAVVGCSSTDGEAPPTVASRTAVPPAAAVDVQGRGGQGQVSDAVPAVERALEARFGDPLSGGECRSIEEAGRTVRTVLRRLGLTDWAVRTDPYAREDGCATAYVRERGSVGIATTVQPDVHQALETFRERSLDACLDKETATRELTAALEAVDHRDFVVVQENGLAGPGDRMAEIMAHAAAGCVIYTGQSTREDGTMVYFVSGG